MPNQAGTAADKLPAAHQLGRMAFQNPEAVVLKPQASAGPAEPGDLVYQLTNDTTLVLKVRGKDGVVRSATLTLS